MSLPASQFIPPPPLSPAGVRCLFSPSVHLPYLYVFGWSVSLAIPNSRGVCGVPHAGPLAGCHADLFSIPEHTYLFLSHSL